MGCLMKINTKDALLKYPVIESNYSVYHEGFEIVFLIINIIKLVDA